MRKMFEYLLKKRPHLPKYKKKNKEESIMQISGVLLNPKERVGMSQISWCLLFCRKMSSFLKKESDPFVSLTGKIHRKNHGDLSAKIFPIFFKKKNLMEKKGF